MSSNSKETFVDMMKMFIMTYHKTATDEEIKLYNKTFWIVLKDCTRDELKYAAIEILKSHEGYMPKPGHVYSYVEEYRLKKKSERDLNFDPMAKYSNLDESTPESKQAAIDAQRKIQKMLNDCSDKMNIEKDG